MSQDPIDRLLPMNPVEFLVLVVLADAEMHGYGLVREIGERTGGRVRLRAGNLYRVLDRLLKRELIEESAKRSASAEETEKRRSTGSPTWTPGRRRRGGPDGHGHGLLEGTASSQGGLMKTSVLDKISRRLLHLFPGRFRKRHGEDLARALPRPLLETGTLRASSLRGPGCLGRVVLRGRRTLGRLA